jgi:hypothetical protein
MAGHDHITTTSLFPGESGDVDPVTRHMHTHAEGTLGGTHLVSIVIGTVTNITHLNIPARAHSRRYWVCLTPVFTRRRRVVT